MAINTIALLTEQLGAARTKDMLRRAGVIEADVALRAGFVSEVVPAEQLDDRVREVAADLAKHAPLTMWATKEAMHRIRVSGLLTDVDIVRTMYGSEDFGRTPRRADRAREARA